MLCIGLNTPVQGGNVKGNVLILNAILPCSVRCYRLLFITKAIYVCQPFSVFFKSKMGYAFIGKSKHIIWIGYRVNISLNIVMVSIGKVDVDTMLLQLFKGPLQSDLRL